jgi:hypothetical protein
LGGWDFVPLRRPRRKSRRRVPHWVTNGNNQLFFVKISYLIRF